MNSDLTALLLDAKCQYLTRITEVVTPFVLQTLHGIHEQARENTTWLHGETYQFQKILKSIPQWNSSIIEMKTNEIVSQTPWFNDLIAAALVTQTKVLSSIRLSADMPDVRLKIPSSEDFVSTMYSEIARHLYYNPQYDVSLLEEIVYHAIERGMRRLIPFQDILNSYLSEPQHVGDDKRAAPLELDDDTSSSSSSSSSESEDDPNEEMHIENPYQQQQQQQPMDLRTPDPFSPETQHQHTQAAMEPVPPVAEIQPRQLFPGQFAPEKLIL